VLAHVRGRSDSSTIYAELSQRAQAGTLKTVRQVFGELKKHKAAHAVLSVQEKHFVLSTGLQLCSEVAEKLELVAKGAGHLWAATGGKNPDPADPWLVAVAAAHGYILVTDESPQSPMKIPAACRLPGIAVTCISGPHYLIAAGIVKEMKPEHIDPHRFFNLS
jgi:hypothetical protein